MAVLDELHATLCKRFRPEDVAELVRQELSQSLTRNEARILDKAARGAHARGSWGYSSMSTEFARPVGLANQVRTARELFPVQPIPTSADCENPRIVTAYIAAVSRVIAKNPQASDFKADRLNREQRAKSGIGELSKRQYNKRFRLLARMERKVAKLEREIRKREYTLVSKSRLASRITYEEFTADCNSACFIAYLTARANLRSEFTNTRQQRAYDEIAEMLLERCWQSTTANWWAIAHIHPTRDVLSHLTQEQLGRFVATWFKLLVEIADLLREVWEKSRFNRETMIVKRGDDSSTWNATAGAWNKAREGWVEVLHAAGMDDILDHMCPGKVLRLMAADVAMWHRVSGGGLEPDTAVWAALPPPWEVLDGSTRCTRADIEMVCRRYGIDPEAKGWTSPRPKQYVEAFRPTPELVHGVEVGHPGLAILLRKIGLFSGKSLKSPSL